VALGDSVYAAFMSPQLTPRQRALLKARAHALEPVVQIGAAGATDSVIAEVDRSLTGHGLIKVRLGGVDREARRSLTETLCARTGAVAVQNVGRVLVLWRPRADDAPLGE
jgi:putative YhbY family RNA-binding protein